MSGNTTFQSGTLASPPANLVVGTDQVTLNAATADLQVIKIGLGAAGAVTLLGIGQAAMAASLPVVLASDQAAIPVTLSSLATLTNLVQMNGAAIAMGTGVRAAGVQRVTIATDDIVPASQSGTWNIGTVTTVTGVTTVSTVTAVTTVSTVTSLTQMNGQAISMGTGTRAAGTQRVTIATDDIVPASQSGTWNIGTVTTVTTVSTVTNVATIGTSVTPGTSAAHLGKAEDAGHTTGDTGVMSLGVRNDTIAAFSNTDLDYTPLGTDSAGRLIVLPFAPVAARVTGAVSVAGTGSTQIIAADGALRLYITDIIIANTGGSTTLITFQDGSGGTALAYTIAVSGGGSNIVHLATPLRTTAATGFFFACGTSSTTVYCTAIGFKAA